MMIADLAVVTARLPYVDRSTLSQAWYDALQLAHTTAAPATPPRMHVFALRRPSGCQRQTTTHLLPPRPCVPRGQRMLERKGFLQGRARIHAQTQKTRRGVDAHVPMTMTHISPRLQQETAIVHLPDGERICLITRNDHGGIRIIALCTAALRPRVMVALSAVQRMFSEQGLQCSLGVGELIS